MDATRFADASDDCGYCELTEPSQGGRTRASASGAPMSMRSMLACCTALCAGLVPVAAVAADAKPLNPAICQPFTASTPDYSLLKIRATGITNAYPVSKYVICALPKDAESGWLSSSTAGWRVGISFTQNQGWLPRLESNVCTLHVASASPGFDWNRYSASKYAIYDATASVPPQRADIIFTQGDFPDFGPPWTWMGDGPAVLVCRIAPRNTLTRIDLTENDPTWTANP